MNFHPPIQPSIYFTNPSNTRNSTSEEPLRGYRNSIKAYTAQTDHYHLNVNDNTRLTDREPRAELNFRSRYRFTSEFYTTDLFYRWHDAPLLDKSPKSTARLIAVNSSVVEFVRLRDCLRESAPRQISEIMSRTLSTTIYPRPVSDTRCQLFKPQFQTFQHPILLCIFYLMSRTDSSEAGDHLWDRLNEICIYVIAFRNARFTVKILLIIDQSALFK